MRTTSTIRADIVRAAGAEPLGVTVNEFCEANPGYRRRAFEQAVCPLLNNGTLFNIVRIRMTRYFASEAQREAARPEVVAMWAAHDAAMYAKNQQKAKDAREANGAVLRKAGSATAISQAVKVKGIAHLAGEADMSRAKWTTAATPLGRYAPADDFPRFFSLVKVGIDATTGEAW